MKRERGELKSEERRKRMKTWREGGEWKSEEWREKE